MSSEGGRSTWAIGGTTLVGLGVGLIYVKTTALVFVASILIGMAQGLSLPH